MEAQEALASLAACWEVLPEPEISEAFSELPGLGRMALPPFLGFAFGRPQMNVRGFGSPNLKAPKCVA